MERLFPVMMTPSSQEVARLFRLAILFLTLSATPAVFADSDEPKRDLALASVSAITMDLQSGEVLVAKHVDAVASGLEQPAGLAFHGGDLYVADRTGTVFRILDDGQTLDAPHPVATGLGGPEGIAAGEDGSLFVVEVDAERVSWINPEDGTTSVVADGLNLSGLEREAISEATAIGYLSGIAVGDGSLFVSAYPDNLVYRID